LKTTADREAPGFGCASVYRVPIMRYFIIALFIILSVVFYVWQNIEVMKISLDYRKSLAVEKKLIKEADKLLLRIEQHRTMESMDRYARSRGLRLQGPGDLDVIEVRERDSNE
jgi:hypothetical protein